MATKKPIRVWSLTVQQNFCDLPSVPRMKEVCDEMAKSWVFQLECGHNAGHEHYQVRLETIDKQMTETMLTVFEARGFDRRDLTFRPESNNSIQQGGLSFYVMKDDTRVDGPWHDATFRPPKKRKVYEGKDLACMANPYPCQAEILRRIAQPSDDRCLDYVWDPEGCSGKSKLMKYLRFRGDDVARVPLGSATQIKTCVIEKGPHSTYMVALPRVRGADEQHRAERY